MSDVLREASLVLARCRSAFVLPLPAETCQQLVVEIDAVQRLLVALLAERQAEGHMCSGCHHRWEGPSGAELCGDCWRKGQSVIFGEP